MKYRYIFLIVLTGIFFLNPERIFAVQDFRADHAVTYSVLSGGSTLVSQHITLTNLQSQYYPRQYTLAIDGTDITDVTAYDKGGPIAPTIVKAKDKTNISLKFNDHPVGIGKTLEFTLRYISGSTAKKIGTIWEVRIPALSENDLPGDYSVQVTASEDIGPLAYANPKPSGDGLSWNKEQIAESGIILSYGLEQKYRLSITYPIENPTTDPVLASITLPPNMAYQSVSIVSLDPKPEKTQEDQDGNILAYYRLNAADSLIIKGIFDVTVSMSAKNKSPVESLSLATYLSPQKFWESDALVMSKLAQELQTPEKIYQYVTKKLLYDYKRAQGLPNRKGALKALEEPTQSVCREFTDLFIAIARAAGIPAREVIGYAYTEDPKLRPLLADGDILHAWPEYYNPISKTWIPIDPTWGNTTGGINYFSFFDFRHIALAIHGVSSEFPPSAGEYKTNAMNTKSIDVDFLQSSQPAAQTEKYSIIFEFPERITAGRTINGVVSVKNTSGTSIDTSLIQIDAYPYLFHLSKTISPFLSDEIIAIPVSIPVRKIFDRNVGRIRVNVNGMIRELEFYVDPLYWYAIPVIILLASVFILWALSKKRSR